MKTNDKNTETETKPLTIEQEHDRMRERAIEFEKEMDGTGVVMAEAFVRGMRDIGYKNTAYALNEVIDNGIEARASHVLVEMLEGKGGVQSIAVVDDGMGMPREWLRHSIRWGASHRNQDDLKGFGRFGYGLKSAAISFARRFEVYSRIPGQKEWTVVHLDVEELASGIYRTENGGVGVPPAKSATLPDWILERLKERGLQLDHGTVVIMSKIDADRIRTRANAAGGADREKLRSFFMEQFGITYRNYLGQTPIRVDGNKVDAIDPLFITPGYRFYETDKDRAEALPPLVVAVKSKDRKDVAGEIRCRFSSMPPTFLRKTEHKLKADLTEGRGSKNQLNERFPIRNQNNGIVMLRAGRQIDVVNRGCPWTVFQNNDRYIGIEVDFDPSLDAEFSVPTSKQQVIPSKRIWDILEENGVYDAIVELRKRHKVGLAAIEELHKEASPVHKAPDDPEMTPSEAAMKVAEKFVPPTAQTETLEQIQRAEEELETQVEAEAKTRKLPPEKIREEKERQAKARPYMVELESKGSQAPFFRAVQEGGQKKLYINQDHRFYFSVYLKTDAIVRLGLETTLFSIGFHWIRSSSERRTFYDSEVVHWSTLLNAALADLESYDGSVDNRQADEETAHATSVKEERDAEAKQRKAA